MSRIVREIPYKICCAGLPRKSATTHNIDNDLKFIYCFSVLCSFLPSLITSSQPSSMTAL